MATLRYTLHVIRAQDVDAIPPLSSVGSRRPEDWFAEATNGQLEVRIVNHTAPISSVDVDGAVLHETIRRFLPVPTSRPVSDIAIVFCRSWRAPAGVQLFGLMFDYDGTDPRLGTFSTGDGVPREACAVFVDSFSEGEDRETIFTAIHELGHVFNLQHDPAETTFMAGDNFDTPGFNSTDAENLIAAARGNFFFAPGGDNFGDFGGGAARLANIGPKRGTRSLWHLKLHLAKDRYLMGEPTVVDITLHPSADQRRFAQPQLDPGYSALKLYYETPLGERRLHRPPHWFCRHKSGNVEVSRRRPMTHNPVVSLGNRGPNFNAPGRYRLWAEFMVKEAGHKTLVRSKDVTFEIVSPVSEREEAISQVLSNRVVAFFVAHKGGGLPQRWRRRLAAITKRESGREAVQHLRYALAVDHARAGRFRQAEHQMRGIALVQPSLKRGLRRLERRIGRALH